MALAFFSTWTTYGTWLPGDGRGWFQHGRLHEPDLMRAFEAALRMRDDAVTLDRTRRAIVESTIAEHCGRRGWSLHAVNCRSNHVHVVVSAPGREIEVPREQFKSWCSRKLTEQAVGTDREWWTQRGWDEFVDDVRYLENCISYVRDGQDNRGPIDRPTG